MAKTLLTIGHGYCARALARLLLPQGWRIIGTTRAEQQISDLGAQGIDVRLWPGADLTDDLATATHLLISAAPNENGDPFLNAFGNTDLSGLEWTGYLSTTGVYGDHGGAWVDETTPLAPTTKRGQHRALAEQQWQALAQKQALSLHIFRLAGIYGPGRGPFAKLQNQTARRIIKPDQVFSRIHVDDVAHCLAASMANPHPNAIYNLCDDDPAPPQDILEYAANLLNLPVPRAENWDTADMSAMARSFYAENKKVRNTRLKRDLGVILRFPTYKSGLQALLKCL